MANNAAISFKQLRALIAVTDCGSITQAAQLLGLTPPAVHTQLRLLEQNFDCKLLDRSGASPKLTLQGQTVLEAARAIDSTLGSCAQHVRALNEGKEGQVVLGVVSTGKYFAPGLVARLQNAFPRIEVVMKVGNRDLVLGWLQNRALDLAIMGRPPRMPPVVSVPLGQHPHVMIAPPEHRLAQMAEVPADDLLDETILSREEGSGTRILMARYLDRVGQGRPYKTVELGSNETIKQAVMAGLGLALISRHTVTDELAAGRLVELPVAGLPLVRQWFLLHHEDMPLTQAGRTVHDFIAAQNGSFLPA